jgi:hypothetical protein
MAAGVSDVRLIDPSEAELVSALRKAHSTANRGSMVTKMKRDRDFWIRFARDCRREPEGRRRSCSAGLQTPEVIAGWWTDPAGRKHFRVIGRTRRRDRRHYFMRGEGELRDLPPWWHVYPESVLAVRRADGGESYLACCRCGNVGTPESLGWMGDTCGPCFDRRAEGGVVAGGFGLVGGWAGGYGHVCFSSDSRRLVGPESPSKVRCLERTTGTDVRIKGLQSVSFPAVGTDGGFLFAFGDGRVVRWDGAQLRPVPVLATAGTYGRPVIDPRGRWAMLVAMNMLFVADLAAESPRYEEVPLERHYMVLRFDPVKSRLLAIATDGSLCAFDPATRTQTVLRENIFAGLPVSPYPSDVSVSPDGASVAVARHFYNYHANVVRVVPLRDDQPAFDLPVPRHHRPVAVAFAPDGKHLATFDPNEGWVGFWRLPAGKALGFVRARLESPGSRYAQAAQVSFSPDGATLAVLYSEINQARGAAVALWPWPEILAAAGSAQ